MTELKDMQLFVCAVEQGSFAKAAAVVGLSPAMVGRRIASMERELGFLLFNRSTRNMQLSAAAEPYYQGCLRILSEVAELEDSVSSAYLAKPKGLIRLSAPDGLACPFLLSAVAAFRQQYADIYFEFDISNKPQDLIKEKIDLSLRLAFKLDDSDLVAKPLSRTGFSLYASPEYLKKQGQPECLADLKQHSCLHMGASKYGQHWVLLQQGQPVHYKQDWSLILPNTESLLEAVSRSMGIALIPDLFAARKLRSQELKKIKGIAEFPQLTLYCLYPRRKHLPYRVQLFLDFLIDWSQQHLAEI